MAALDSQLKMDAEADATPSVAVIDTKAPFEWINKGIADFKKIPGLSLLYGFIFTAVTVGVLLATRNSPWMTLAYVTGLVIVGPYLAAGLYAASRDIENGKEPSIASSLNLIYERKTYLALFAVMLTLVMAAWIRFTALFFAITSSGLTQTEGFLGLLLDAENISTLIFFVGSGAFLVVAVFTCSAIAIPYIMDKDANFIKAIVTSYKAVTANPAAMFTWGAAIAVLTAIGMATAFIGLIAIFPILGYATWHSYRALVS